MAELCRATCTGSLRGAIRNAAVHLKPNDRQRLSRALEVLEGTGKPLSHWQRQAQSQAFLKDVYTSNATWLMCRAMNFMPAPIPGLTR